jgi:hypothetical protein
MASLHLCDAHTHFFSRQFFELLAGQAAQARGLSDASAEDLLRGVLEQTGIELPDPSPRKHAERWLTELDRHGVEKAVTFASLPAEAEAVREACESAGGRLIPFVLVDPTSPTGIDSGRRALAEKGFRGVLLFPAIQKFDPADASLTPLYDEAARRRAPVIVHCGILAIKLRDLLGLRPAYDLRYANPLAVTAAAERHRDTNFIIPHFGGGFLREALIAGAQSPNVFLDTSSSNSWTPVEGTTLEEVFRRVLAVFGPRRILFGTDSCTFPRGWRADILAEQRRIIGAMGLDGADEARILGGNLLELLGLRNYS